MLKTKDNHTFTARWNYTKSTSHHPRRSGQTEEGPKNPLGRCGALAVHADGSTASRAPRKGKCHLKCQNPFARRGRLKFHNPHKTGHGKVHAAEQIKILT